MQLQQAGNEHFQQLFYEDGNTNDFLSSDFLSNIPSLVTQDDNVGLVKSFFEKEVVDVIWAMEPPGQMDSLSISTGYVRTILNFIFS